MPWNDTARVEHRRDCARYPSDLTDREWGLIEPLLPAARPGERPRTTDMRAVLEAIPTGSTAAKGLDKPFFGSMIRHRNTP